MKLIKLEVYVFDFEDYGAENAIDIIENNKYLNAKVKVSESVEIDDWDDDHELNQRSATREQFLKYFLTS